MNSLLRKMIFACALGLALYVSPFATKMAASGQGKETRVPPNEIHVVVNKKGEKTRQYGSGEAWSNTDCVQYKCPKALKNAGGKGK